MNPSIKQISSPIHFAKHLGERSHTLSADDYASPKGEIFRPTSGFPLRNIRLTMTTRMTDLLVESSSEVGLIL